LRANEQPDPARVLTSFSQTSQAVIQQLATGLLRSGDNATNFTRYSELAQQRDALWVNSAFGSGPMLPAKGDRRFARITAGLNIDVLVTARRIRKRLCRMRSPEWMMPC
jgi:hypothetical protein